MRRYRLTTSTEPTSAIVYHQRRTTRVERLLAEVERVAAHKRDSGRPL